MNRGSTDPDAPGASGAQPAALVRGLHAAQLYLSRDFLGGPRLLTLAALINVQKGATGPFVLGLMALFQNWNASAWIYLALHGSYGLCWLLKHAAFADARWNVRITLGGAALSFLLALGLYWVAPLLVVSRAAPEAPAWLAAVSVGAHTLGVALMLTADAQKHFALKPRPGLITTGLFARVRHPNYLGEMLIYGAYALLAQHWLPWLILAWVWLGVFLPNMLMIEHSLARYPDWPAYKARTGMLLPRLW